MEYEFSFVSFLVGLGILVAGIAFMKWHQKIADSLGSGMPSYERYKFWAAVTCAIGFLMLFNLPMYILVNLLKAVFPTMI